MKKPNIIILVIDTLREDHSQGLEKLRELGFVKYENAIAPAPWTLPSHISLITGLYPSQHGVHEAFGVYPDREMMGLSASQLNKLNHGIIGELMEEDYNTYIFSANPFLSPYFGFNKYTESFIVYYSSLDKVNDIKELNRIRYLDSLVNDKGYIGTAKYLINQGNYGLLFYGIKTFIMRRLRKFAAMIGLLDLTMEKGSTLILKLLNEIKLNEPFFLLINIMEAHGPYVNSEFWSDFAAKAVHKAVFENVIDERVANILRKEYSRHAEYAVNKAIDIVHTLNRYLDNALFIITSDHGELLGDGGLSHGYFLKDGLLRVPLWVKWPNSFRAPKQNRPFISLVEIPSMIKAAVNNDDCEVGSSVAISESFGPPPWLLPNNHKARYKNLSVETLIKKFSHRIRIYTSKCTFTYDESLDSIEDNNCEESVARRIIDVIRPTLNVGPSI